MALVTYIIVVLLVSYVNSENATSPAADTCEPWEEGPWGALLEEWATSAPPHSGRHGRIMALPAANGYYVTERIDGPLVPPPPPPLPPGSPGPHHSQEAPHGPQARPAAHAPHHIPLSPATQGMVPQSYNEWEANPPPPGGKIVNRPPNPYKDKFRPSYEYAPPPPRPPAPQRPAAGSVDRVDEPPRKQVSETDLYLLGAIEKLVYRVDLMEKRLRKAEESLHYLVAGTAAKPEPCPENYTRVGEGCYEWSREAADWQGASAACRRRRAALLELRSPAQRRLLLATLLADKRLAGNDFWTGGLNPGLLWIWSHSARPVEGNGTEATVQGEGRCLALVHDPAARSYVYRGQDCALKHRYICQKEEDKTKLSNEIEKAARSLRLDKARKTKVLRLPVDDDGYVA